jgi:hypothetical protein
MDHKRNLFNMDKLNSKAVVIKYSPSVEYYELERHQ